MREMLDATRLACIFQFIGTLLTFLHPSQIGRLWSGLCKMSFFDVVMGLLGLMIGLIICTTRLVRAILRISGRFVVAMASDPNTPPAPPPAPPQTPTVIQVGQSKLLSGIGRPAQDAGVKDTIGGLADPTASSDDQQATPIKQTFTELTDILQVGTHYMSFSPSDFQSIR